MAGPQYNVLYVGGAGQAEEGVQEAGLGPFSCAYVDSLSSALEYVRQEEVDCVLLASSYSQEELLGFVARARELGVGLGEVMRMRKGHKVVRGARYDHDKVHETSLCSSQMTMLELREMLLCVEERLPMLDGLAQIGLSMDSLLHELLQPVMALLNNIDFVELLLHRAQAGEVSAQEWPEYLEELSELRGDLGEELQRLHRIAGFVKPFKAGLVEGEGMTLVNEVVRYAFLSMRQLVRPFGILRHRCPEVPLYIRGDGFFLGQILLHLLRNSIEAISTSIASGASEASAHSILIEASLERDEVVVKVEDSGPGMTPQLQERIFDACFSTKEQAGSGLGLAICQKRVAQLGGRMEVKSTPGSGTCFVLSFPHVADFEPHDATLGVVASR